jgi:hypothetical protein
VQIQIRQGRPSSVPSRIGGGLQAVNTDAVRLRRESTRSSTYDVSAAIAATSAALGPKTGPDQGECRSSPLESLEVRTNSDTSAGQRGYCGISAVIRSAAGERRLAWFRCDSMHCRICGPRVRAQRVKLYAEAVGRAEVRTFTIADTAWSTRKRRLERQHAEYLRVPIRGGAVVLHTGQDGRQVGHVIAWLETALDELEQGRRISTSRKWALVRRRQDTGWELVGISREGPAVMAAVALRTVGLDDSDRLLHAGDPALWRQFIAQVGLHLPNRLKEEPPKWL